MARITVVAGDPAASDEAAQRLLKELHGVAEIIAVEQATVPGAADGRSVDALAVGTLLLTLAATPEVLGGVLTYLMDWRRRPGNNRGTLRFRMGDRELEITDPTPAERKKLIDAFVRELRRR
ncbi:hypothetical protein Asp14428_79670 [Actinoplanes sp. NBRC 14428]|uniref:Uncharacterized protein n=1 Tax=Pseudosporangium ferrugineum TaxID=439699 RepID=A0A2T0SJI0_9ACTN|nr:hypothetical protein CLV70_101721 [Pseudosporangium ferrugineum]BCJ56492.1 hypothetical protein Asp14428_79670 [Actinoplanes sp. NBRC 14428]